MLRGGTGGDGHGAVLSIAPASFLFPQDPSIARKPVATKPKRVQKGNERVPASRKKLRKDEGLRPSEALVKQLKQVWLGPGAWRGGCLGPPSPPHRSALRSCRCCR